MKKILYYFLLFSLIVLIGACKKYLEIPGPKNEIVAKSAFETAELANSAMVAVYLDFYSLGASYPISYYCGIAADELQNYSSGIPMQQYYQNAIATDNASARTIWKNAYLAIYQCNAIIENLQDSPISSMLKQRLTAEAKFNRAFWHFYLVNLYGAVPVITSSSYAENMVASRSLEAKVYEQIVSDLKDAQENLPDHFVGADGTTLSVERVRPNKWAATALLARTYLYIKKYAEATTEASKVINKTELFEMENNLDAISLKNRKEQIWQLFTPPNQGINTYEGAAFILTFDPFTNGETNVSTLSNQLLSSFETGDKRRTNWVGNYNSYAFPKKYKIDFVSDVTEYLSILRLAEQYLIRGEARAHLGDLDGSRLDINVVRKRAGVSEVTTSDKNMLLKAILHERQIEFFSEWGHRWMDLKRTGQIDEVMKEVTPAKGGIEWKTYQQLFPIPQTEINKNPNLTQNIGYN